MKRWLISLAGAEADLAQLVGTRDGDEWQIDQDPKHGVLLSAQRFEDKDSYEAVSPIADALISRINTSARYYDAHFQGIKRHTTIERRDGQDHMAVQLGQAVEVNVAASIGWIKNSPDGKIVETSEDQIKEERANRIPRLAVLQEEHRDLGAALRYLQDEPDMYGLYKAAEAIGSALNSGSPWEALKRIRWTSGSELERFKRSAQIKRHHDFTGPKMPMTLSEADTYVRTLLAKLIDYLDSTN